MYNLSGVRFHEEIVIKSYVSCSIIVTCLRAIFLIVILQKVIKIIKTRIKLWRREIILYENSYMISFRVVGISIGWIIEIRNRVVLTILNYFLFCMVDEWTN